MVRTTFRKEYSTGDEALEMPKDAVVSGRHYFIVDDLLATGGTAAAVRKMITDQGGIVIALTVFIEIASLQGRNALPDLPIIALMTKP